MTMEEIRNSDSDFLNVLDISDILHVKPQNLRNAIKFDPKAVGFPVIVVGTRIKIPRRPFLKFIEG